MYSGEGDSAEPIKPVTAFLGEEYKALRDEIKSLVAENQTLERYAGGAVAAVATWLLTVKDIPDDAWNTARYVPVFITILAALRCRGIGVRLSQIGAYIRTYEAWLMQERSTGSNPPPRGWETTLHDQNGNQENISGISSNGLINKSIMGKAPFYTTAYTYWAVLFTVTLIFFFTASPSVPVDKNASKQTTVTVSDPSGSSSTVTVPLGFRIEVKRPTN